VRIPSPPITGRSVGGRDSRPPDRPSQERRDSQGSRSSGQTRGSERSRGR
jgi:hypothetical protein